MPSAAIANLDRPDASPRSKLDPCRVADLTLAAAVRASADLVYIEPMPLADDSYVVTFERESRAIATTSLDAHVATAMIARLAYIADIDLVAGHAASGVVPVRSGAIRGDVVITIRPGASLRAELMVVKHQQRPTTAKPAQLVAPSKLAPNETIGNYKVIERLGEGGMGTVFSVEHIALGRRYALKVLRSKVVEREPTAAQRFLREARAAARIRHPNIVDVFDFGHLGDGRPYFVMELLEGQSLADLVDREGAMPPGHVVAIARQLANALAAAHDRGVIHADVTPSNALVVGGDDIQVKLLDFGLAELAGEVMRDDNAEFVLGTPAYISPEQLRGLAPTDRSDQYGLGAVLFELLTGQPPFVDANIKQLCVKHLTAPVPPVTSPHGPLPPKLADVITTCLQKSPQARFPGMRAMIAALDEIERVTDRRGWRRWLSS